MSTRKMLHNLLVIQMSTFDCVYWLRPAGSSQGLQSLWMLTNLLLNNRLTCIMSCHTSCLGNSATLIAHACVTSHSWETCAGETSSFERPQVFEKICRYSLRDKPIDCDTAFPDIAKEVMSRLCWRHIHFPLASLILFYSQVFARLHSCLLLWSLFCKIFNVAVDSWLIQLGLLGLLCPSVWPVISFCLLPVPLAIGLFAWYLQKRSQCFGKIATVSLFNHPITTCNLDLMPKLLGLKGLRQKIPAW